MDDSSAQPNANMVTSTPGNSGTASGAGATKASAGGAAGSQIHTQPTHMFVRFVIVTPDRLRKIIFELQKTEDSQDNSWNITFELDERTDTSEDFNQEVQLAVAVDHDDDDKAMSTFRNGLDSDQHAQALVAGQTAKDAKTGANGTTQDDAETDTAGVVSARNPNSPK
jgi:hypothetical protein